MNDSESIMPTSASKNDRKEIAELCARRKKDYALVGAQKGIFLGMDEGCLPKKKPQNNFSPADVRKKLKFRPCPAGSRNSSRNKRYDRPLTPLGEFSRVAPFEKLDEEGNPDSPFDKLDEEGRPDSSSPFDEFDPDRFVIGSTPKKGFKKPSCRDNPKTPEIIRPFSSLEVRDHMKPVYKPILRTREPSAASELDLNLLEDSDEEDEIFPYPSQFRHSVDQIAPQVSRTESYRQPTRPLLQVEREVSVPTMSEQVKMKPQPSRSVECSLDCTRIKPWGFKWAANKICRSAPIVKHN